MYPVASTAREAGRNRREQIVNPVLIRWLDR